MTAPIFGLSTGLRASARRNQDHFPEPFSFPSSFSEADREVVRCAATDRARPIAERKEADLRRKGRMFGRKYSSYRMRPSSLPNHMILCGPDYGEMEYGEVLVP